MSKLRVGVLRGGPSSEYEISLKTGGHVLQNLSEEKYAPRDIFISRDGVWHVRGLETAPERALQHVDVVFNALHGEYGEDGTVQKILKAFHIPYTGSNGFASALAMMKPHAKEVVSRTGVKTPLHVVIERSLNVEDRIFEVFRTFPQPAVVKPTNKGSSLGVLFVGSYQELFDAVMGVLENAPSVLVEEYIRGKEVTSGVIDNFRGEKHYTFLPIEIVLPKGKQCFDYDAKYNGACTLRCPGNLSSDEKLRIRDTTRKVHEALGLSHYSRSDFIVTSRDIYFLEANTLPGLTESSLVPLALKEAGSSMQEFIDHVINLAIARN